jgi:hypothetical protein
MIQAKQIYFLPQAVLYNFLNIEKVGIIAQRGAQNQEGETNKKKDK